MNSKAVASRKTKSINSESVRLLMFQKRLRRSDLSELLGISVQMVSNYQSQDKWPPKHLLKIITTYGMLEQMVPRSELDD